MPILTVRMNKLHIRQAEIMQHPARFRVLSCGRRFGKTESIIYEIAHRAIRGQLTAYFAPSYKMTHETWRQLMWRLEPVIKHSNRTEGRIELITGGAIEFWSLSTTSAESVRGRKYHFVAIDEAALIWNLQDVWEQIIQPLLVDYRGGAFFCSTPRGRNDFYTFYQYGITGVPEWYSWNFPTVANPYIDPAEVERARQTTVERNYRQEYLAEFVEDAGSVFRGVTKVSVLDPAGGPTQAHRYVFGVDWGRDIDFTVISVLDATTQEQVALDRFTQVSYSLQLGRLRALADIWQPQAIWAEANSMGGPLVETLQMDERLPVHPFYTTHASKAAIIESLSLAIERERLTLLDNPVQKNELQAYMMERSPSGSYSYGAPPGAHDDCVMALAIAYYGASRGGAPAGFLQIPVRDALRELA